MEKRLINDMNIYLQDLRRLRKDHSERIESQNRIKGVCLKRRKAPGDSWYYYERIDNSDKRRYLGKNDVQRVQDIKQFRYYSELIKAVDNNIAVIDKALKKIMLTDYAAIEERLPRVYRGVLRDSAEYNDDRITLWKESAKSFKSRRGVYRPEDLIIRTDDGNMVRSKSEALIYNYLLRENVVFEYELPQKIGTSIFYPDFTLLSDIDKETEIIIEHQGMMANDNYRNRFSGKVHSYLRAGYMPGKDVFFTFDHINGGFDITPIEDIVRNKIKASV